MTNGKILSQFLCDESTYRCDQKCADHGIAWQNASTRQLATRHDETPAAGRMRVPSYPLASHVALLDAVTALVPKTTTGCRFLCSIESVPFFYVAAATGPVQAPAHVVIDTG